MNPRHAAALALVGWALILPMQVPAEHGTANADSAPAATSTFAVYKTAEDCDAERRQLLSDPVVGERMKDARCVEEEVDPRLKGN
jgi:hypothetical protein